MDIKEFYKEKTLAYKRLVVQLVRQGDDVRLQPPLETELDEVTEEPRKFPVAVYLTSIRNQEKGTTAGKVSVVPVGRMGVPPDNSLAAQLIAQMTHRVSTTEEIEGWLQEQVVQKRRHDVLDARRDDKKRGVRDEDINPMPEHLKQAATKVDDKAKSKTAGKQS